MAIRLGSRRSVVLLALAGLVIYIAWIGGPYLSSIIVRDAAVTTWINHTASPSGDMWTSMRWSGSRRTG